jgi:hypothetical protein
MIVSKLNRLSILLFRHARPDVFSFIPKVRGLVRTFKK